MTIKRRGATECFKTYEEAIEDCEFIGRKIFGMKPGLKRMDLDARN